MPFKKGNQLAKGIGRKGYEYELEEMKKMRNIFNEMLDLVEKIMNGEATTTERIKYEDLQKITLKIMDKLHANKQFVELSGQIEKVDVSDKELEEYKKWRTQKKEK